MSMLGLVLTSHMPLLGKASLIAVSALGIGANFFDIWMLAPGGTAAIARVGRMKPSVIKSFLGIVLTRPIGLR